MVTNTGGQYGDGGVFELTVGGQYIDLHDFQGESQNFGLVLDSNDNLFGTCGYGGSQNNGGILWEITKSGSFTVLHNFGSMITYSNGKTGLDGTEPSGVTIDGQGNLFGTCLAGGANGYQSASGMAWEYTSGGVYRDLHDFAGAITRADGTTGMDGTFPNPGIVDASGNFYGTTETFADFSNGGNFWKITPTGNFIDLHDFGGHFIDSSGNQANDGYNPVNVVIDSNGNLYGNCGYDGQSYTDWPSGLIWELTTSGVYKIIHDFNGGEVGPLGMLFDRSGNMFGAASGRGGDFIWEITPAGVLYDIHDLEFDSYPSALKLDPSGLLCGITAWGGSFDNGSSDEGGTLYTLAVGPYLDGLSITPASVVSGKSATGTVTLELPTASALVVNLTSSNSNVTVPATVTIPAGGSSITFAVSTIEAATDQTATITASASGFELSTTFTAQAIALSGMTLDSNYVNAGTSLGGTVTLNGPALSGGLTITLASNNPHATVPSSVTVLAGQTSARFTVSSIALTSFDSATISATDDGSHFFTESLSLQPTPISSLTITPTEAAGSTVFTARAGISGVAGSGGFPISVTSSSSSATPPTTITVPAGQSSVAFQIPTSTVTAKTTVTITATAEPGNYYATSKTANITLDLPPTITNLSVSPGEGPSGSTFTATATINEPAPTGGTVITVGTNSPYVSPPTSVTVPAGSTSVSFPVATAGVPNTISVLLRASIGSAVKTVYFTIDAAPVPALTNLTVSPGEALGGTTFTATITLASPAPFPISVATATNSSFVSIPAIVTVPTGSSTVSYSVKTKAVYNTIPVLLKATLASTTKTVYLTLDATPLPITLTSLTVSPTEAAGGTTFTATATLSAPAPAGGITVVLATNSQFVSLPASVTIPAGSTSATFSVGTSAVSKSVSVLLEGSYNSTTKTVYVTLDP